MVRILTGQQSADKQWGLYTQNGTSDTSVTFSVAFSSLAYSIAVTCSSTSSSGAQAIGVYTRSKTGFVSAGYGTNRGTATYFALGVQQWGAISVNSNLKKHSFVIPFAKECYYCGCIPWKTANSGYCSVAYTISKTEFETYYFEAHQAVSACYIALGMQQWGRSTEATLNFPMPFQKFYCIATAQESWSSATFENTSWIVRTNNSMTWPTRLGTNINYIAVGIQQWGYTEATAVTFPIVFTQSCYTVNCNGSNWGSSGGATSAGISIKNITLKSFDISTWEKPPFRWFALGMQQWGVAENTSVGNGNAGTYSASFPLAFSTVYQIVCSTVKAAESYKGAPNIYSYTTSTVTFSTYDGWYVDKAMYIAVGR